MDYAHYIRTTFVYRLIELDDRTQPLWGVMNAQLMVEHLMDAVLMAGKCEIPRESVNWERVPKAHAWFFEQKNDFIRNTQIPGASETSKSPRFGDYITSRARLFSELWDLDFIFQDCADKDKGNCHPAFGQLTNEEWYEFTARHCAYHLAQFGIENPFTKK